MVKFRFHRGSLDDSMQTVIEVADREELVRCINDEYHYGPLVRIEDLEVRFYADDERIGWKTHIVMFDGSPVGFTDGMI